MLVFFILVPGSVLNDSAQMREDLRRLTGKPVLEVYREWADKMIQSQTKSLQQGVYIETMVCGAGPKEDFLPNETDNRPERITKMFQSFFEGGKAPPRAAANANRPETAE